MRTNCPNCGAVISGHVCNYCGTKTLDFSSMNPMENVYIKIQNRCLKCVCRALSINMTPNEPADIEANFIVLEDVT